MVALFDTYSDLFPGVTAATIRAAAEEPDGHTRTIMLVADDLEIDTARTQRVVEGAPESGTVTNPRVLSQQARTLAANGLFGVALLQRFADDVEAFDTVVHGLNTQLVSAMVTGLFTGDGPAEVKRRLRPQWVSAYNRLDERATTVGQQFQTGPTTDVVRMLMLAGLIPLTAQGLWPELELTSGEQRRALRNMLERFAPGERIPGMTQQQQTAYLDKILQLARTLGLDPQEYRDVIDEYWRYRAADIAGIDLASWDPSQGADGNKETIEAVYNYYAQLYLNNPDLQWAGMARMIGPSFAAGFFDLAMFRRFGETVEDLPAPLRAALPPGLSQLAGLTADDIEFYETTFLDMQKQIFDDQGTMHQAYVDGGMTAIREMEAAGLIPRDIAEAWADIDSGDPDRVSAANETFLYREQWDVINDDYQRMYDHAPTGPAMTWAMTQVGTPSIPGAQGYPDVFPLTVTAETPGPEDIPLIGLDNPFQGSITVETPFADGNIAHFDDRWALIQQDTLPRYQELLANDPALVRDLVEADVGSQIDDYRLDEQIDDILGQMLDWEIDVDQ